MATPPNGNTTSAGVVPDPFPPIPSLDNTYGSIMLGTFGGLMLYGLTVHQGYRYVHLPSYKKDATYIKVMVALVLLVETIHSVLSMHCCYYFFAKNYLHPQVLFHGAWSINLLPMSTGIVIVISQSFFARRLYEFNRCYAPIAGFVVILLLGELGLTMASTVEAFVQPDLLHFERYSWMSITALGLVVAVDGTLTIVLTVVLHRSRTGFKSTDSVISVLILYTINTGLLTGTVTLITFIVGVVLPHTLIDDGISLVAAKLYANSMLAVLNTRHFLSSHLKDDHEYTPSKASAISDSAFASHKPQGTSGCTVCRCTGRCRPSPGIFGKGYPTPEVVLDIRADPDVRFGISSGDDSVFTELNSERSLEQRKVRNPPKDDDVSQDPGFRGPNEP